MRPTQLALSLGLVLATLGLPTGGAAQPIPTSKAAPVDDAARLYQEGNDLYKKKDYPGAEAKYVAAWALAKTFDVAANLGLVELELKKYREAAEYLAFSLRNAPPSAKPAQRDSTRQALEEAKKHLCTVRLALSPPGAMLTVDGQTVAPEMAAAELFVLPGKRTIAATHPDREPASTSLEAAAGTTADATLTLKEKAKIDALPLPTATATAPPPTRSALPIFVLGGAAVVALGVGVGLNVSAASDDGKVRTTSEEILGKKGSCVPGATNFDARCPALESQARSAQTLSGASVGLMVGAGVLAGGALVYWLLPGAAPVRFGAAVVPENGRVAGAMSVTGKF